MKMIDGWRYVENGFFVHKSMDGRDFFIDKYGWQGLEFPIASLKISCIASFWKLFIM